jgi:hypothetical protein
MKRLGLAVIIMAGLVFGIEGVLTLLRQRNIYVVIQVQDKQQVQFATPQATSEAGALPATPEAKSKSLIMTPDGTLEVQVRWDYRIGPRFPVTVVRADVLNTNQDLVASESYTIDCGIEALECNGNTPLLLNFGIKDKAGTRAPWPDGEYSVLVIRTFVGFKPSVITKQTFQVAAQQ